ncbi:MAG: hypothetical protein ACTSPI_17985 [Candidatus Heimdallarchaeaceae archaeon]
MNLYLGDKKEEFETELASILKHERSYVKISHTLSNYIKSLKAGELSNLYQLILLVAPLFSYWAKDYEMIVDFYKKFNPAKTHLTFLKTYAFY